MGQRTCSIDGCDRKAKSRGWCQKHYLRWYQHGDPLALPRFDPWSKIDKRGPDECWPWTKSTDRDCYGVTKIDGRQWRVARWILTQKVGRDLGPEELTRHTCDNPPCCNPAHLTIGTPAENTADMIRRGRSVPKRSHWAHRHPERVAGENNPAARLTEDDVRAIRHEYATERTRQVDLASRYGVTQGLISAIIRRASWAHIE